MDVAALAGLTAAWLAAVVRTQSKPPALPHAGPGETLTDVIEGALRSGGIDSTDPGRADPARPGQVVNRLV